MEHRFLHAGISSQEFRRNTAHIATRSELYRLAGIDKELLDQLVNFLEVFKIASVEMEATKHPTLHLPLPWYYKMVQHCQSDDHDLDEMASLKAKAVALLEAKFIVVTLHHAAAVLNPKMRSLRINL